MKLFPKFTHTRMCQHLGGFIAQLVEKVAAESHGSDPSQFKPDLWVFSVVDEIASYYLGKKFIVLYCLQINDQGYKTFERRKYARRCCVRGSHQQSQV